MHKKTWIETSITIALLSISLLTLAISVKPVKASGDLAGHWKFDEESGTIAYDSSGNGNHGTIYGATHVDGKIGKALGFDGVDDNVEVPDSDSLDVTDALAVSFWFKSDYDVYAGFPEAYLFVGKWHGIGDQARTGFLVNLNEYSDGHMRLWLGFGNWEMNILSSSKITWSAGVWYHVAATYDTSLPYANAKLYIDGVLDSQLDDYRPLAPNTLPLYINIDPYELWHPWNTYFPGIMDDVRVYSRALSEGEIKELSQVVDWWPMFSHDPGHTGYSTSKAPNTNNTLWSFEADTQWITGPSVANGRVFSGADNGRVYALNESNGALLWNYATAGPTGIPAVSEGTVFAPSNDNKLYALNESTGALIWNFALGGDVLPPAVADGMVFTGTGRSWEVNGRLYALNETNGNLIWSYTSADGFCSPAVADGMVFSADDDGGVVYAFDEFNGSIKWSYSIGVYMDDAPSVDNGILYIGAWNGLLYALNETNGNLLWTSPAGPWGAAVAIAHDMVIYSFEGGNEIRALNAVTGSFNWSYFAGDRLSRLAVADGKVFAASKDRKVYALNESTGLLIWSYDSGIFTNEAPCVPSVADDILFVGSCTEYGVPAKLFAFGQAVHDVAVADVTSSKTVVGKGYSMNVTAKVANQGSQQETFNVTLYAQSQTPVNNTGLAGHWNLDEGTGTVAHDSSGNSRDGTLMNGPAWVDGKFGKALQFDGTDDYVDISSSSDMNLYTQHTVSFWMKTTSTSRNIIIAKHISGYPNGWLFAVNEQISGKIAFFYGTDTWLNSNKTVNDGIWHSVTGVVDNTNKLLLLYIDGNLDSSKNITGTFTPNSENVRFGSYGVGGGSYYNGLLDEVKICDRFLSADEIWTEYAQAPVAIQTRTIALEAGESTNLTFNWNTTGWAKGNYTMSVTADAVLGETDTADNTLIGMAVYVGIPGDVVPEFGNVDIKDIYKVAKNYGTVKPPDNPPWDSTWGPVCDINNDGSIDVKDYYIVCKNYGKPDP